MQSRDSDRLVPSRVGCRGREGGKLGESREPGRRLAGGQSRSRSQSVVQQPHGLAALLGLRRQKILA
jgi:hypothetical protein